jgi:Zn-dependent alcohol dehydrogenase
LLAEQSKPLEVVDLELGPPGPGEVRVRVAACGVCHSDVSLVDGTFPIPGPTVPGHEAAGVVVEVGSGVDRPAVGDHVILSPSPSCGHCRQCRRGRFSVCEESTALVTFAFPDGTTRLSRGGELVFRGLGLAGWAEEVIVKAQGAIPIPEDVPLDVACVIGCAVQTGVGAALNTADLVAGDTVLVHGAGGIGVSIVAGAAVAGAARIIVSDPSESRREQAMAFGATDVIDPTVLDVAAAVADLVPGGVDAAFDAVGSAALVTSSLESTCSGGEVVMVGAAPIDQMLEISAVGMMFSSRRLKGCLLGSCWAPRDIPRIVSLWQSGRLPLDSMVTSRRPLAEVNEAVADAAAGVGLRHVLTMP